MANRNVALLLVILSIWLISPSYCAFCQLALQDSIEQANQHELKSLQREIHQSPGLTMERFGRVSTYLERSVVIRGDVVDSAWCFELYNIAVSLNNDSLFAISYNWIALFYFVNEGDNVTALSYLYKGIAPARKTDDKRRISSFYLDIAQAYFNLGNYVKGLENTESGRKQLPPVGAPKHDFMLMQYQSNMAQYYLFTHKPDSALPYIEAMEKTSKLVKSDLFEFGAIYLKGAAYTQKIEYNTAEDYFERAIAFSGRINSNWARLRMQRYYMEFLIATNRDREASRQARMLLNLGNKDKNMELMLAGAEFLRKVYHNNNIDSAYHYLTLESIFKESMSNQNNQNRINSLALADTLQQLKDDEQFRLAEEKVKAQLLLAERELKNSMEFTAIVILIVIVSTLCFLLSGRIHVSENVVSAFGILGLLMVFELINLLSHLLLAKATDDSPILMFLGLVAIALLLIRVHHIVEDWVNEKLRQNRKIHLEKMKRTSDVLEAAVK